MSQNNSRSSRQGGLNGKPVLTAKVQLLKLLNIIKAQKMAMRQQPCPYRIVDDFGNGFSMGCAAGVILYFIRGVWYAPRKEKFMGGVTLLKKRAPILGGSFALWAGLFSMTDCALIGIRQEEGAVNQIVAGAVTGGLLAFRSGARVALKNAIFGGMILGSIVVVERLIMKYQSIKAREMQQQQIEKMTRDQRRELAKQYPQLFEGTGDNLIPRIHRI